MTKPGGFLGNLGHSQPSFRGSLLLAAAVGLGMPFAFAPFSYAWLMPMLLAVLMWLQYGRSPAQAFKLGFAFGSTGFTAGLYWLYISTHVYSGAPAALSVVLIVALALQLSLYGATAAALAAWLGRSKNQQPYFGLWLLIYVCAWPLMEWFRNVGLLAFPWFSLGYSQTDTWLNGFAPIVGVFGLAIPVLVAAALPLALAIGRTKTVAIPLLLLLGLAAWGQQQDWTTANGEPLRVGIAQGNIEQDQKWLPQNRASTARLYNRLTQNMLGDAELVIWPEVAIPGAYREFSKSLFDPLSLQLKQHNTQLLAGVMRWDDESSQYANSVVQLPALGTQAPRFYDKQRLVPFAEYFPVPNFVRGWLKSLELPFTDLHTGDGNREAFDFGEYAVAMSICFEDVFGQEIAAWAAGADILANVSNDAWFGRSIAAAQHEQIARMRSLETRRWMARATPTGFSAFINPQGELVQRLPRGEQATAVAEVQPRQGSTPYMVLRNQWMFVLLLVLFAVLLFRIREQREQRLQT